LCSPINRIRKVKCDEKKPFCHKCVGTGRTCDGYESPFRPFHINDAVDGIKSGAGLQHVRPTSSEIAPQDVALLNHYFSTKTMFDVKLDCDEEAKEVLQASLTDPPIRHAVLSLKALRGDLEKSRGILASIVPETPSQDYGLQQYCMALRGLASNLSSPGTNELRSALLCCQVFISIEQVRSDFAAMGRHVVQGLRIVHNYRARPYFVAANSLMPARHKQLPLLDVFIIKLFAAPCYYAEPPAKIDMNGTTESLCIVSPHQGPVESQETRSIAPNMRTELTRISALTLEFLSNVSNIESAGNALRLLAEREHLLDSLKKWFKDFEMVQNVLSAPGPEPIQASFMRFFHQILNIILLGTLASSPDLDIKLQIENDRLQNIASNVGERVKAYTRCNGTGNGLTELPKVR
jgi:hypothetical protein